MASVVVVATGAALAVTIPFIALKEIFEKRAQSNLKKHLGAGGKRRKCRVNFGSVDNISKYAQNNAKSADVHSFSDNEDCSSVISLPPNYDDLFHPPPYSKTTIKHQH
ncbi:unnamed protein product [Caenorhabditis angaria]|uniref:Uncharacterized protein n=1 Tax=Caenorhabditis angaria TaxID=860376 RepID=A0A9P1N2Y7_9PELO|nr:unnamed protein product [Caenorhabditis angaria]